MKYGGKRFVPVCKIDYMMSVLLLTLQYSSFICSKWRQAHELRKTAMKAFRPVGVLMVCFCCFRLPAVQGLLRDDGRRAHPPTEVLRRGECTATWRNYMHSGSDSDVVFRGRTGISWNKINKNVWKVIWECQDSCGMNYVQTKLFILIFL
jgi:hypothetical protein